MKYLICAVALGWGLAADHVAAQDTAVDEDLAAVKETIDSYVEAFNKSDAKAMAAHWAEQGEFVMPGGEAIRGRKQLEEEFAAGFAEGTEARLELVDTQVDVVSPSVAVETGVARVIRAEEEPQLTEYKAIHVKSAEGWKIDSVRELNLPSPPPSHYEQLQQLEWIIGTWVDAEDGSAVETTCRWTTNRNFISRSFRVRVDDVVDFEGTQIIGWDPSIEAIRSWLFDSDGGFAVGRWTGEPGRWTVKTLHVMPDGRRASATNIYELVEDGKVRFRSIGRQVDGQLLPNIGPIEMVRSEL